MFDGRIADRRRRRSADRSHGSNSVELLEQRQLLVQPPVSLVVNAGGIGTQMSVQWTQPQPSPAVSFDVTITRTGLVSGITQDVLFETALPAAVAPGVSETYLISEPLAAGSYSVTVVSRGGDGSVSTPATGTFTVSQLVPQMLKVSGRQFAGTSTARPEVSSAVSLTWTMLPGVNSYYVWIGKKNSATPAEYPQIADLAPRSVQGGIYEGNLAAGEYRVWVRDLNGPTNIWSAPTDFAVVGVESFVPVWTSTSAQLGLGSALSWNPVPTAVRYEVELSGAVSATTSVAGTEYRGAFLAAGNYNARVRGFDAADHALDWSSLLSFSISATSYKPAFLSSPPSGIQTNGVGKIVWDGIRWADCYEVTVQSTGGTVYFRERMKTAQFQPSLLAVGIYNVTVKAIDTANGSTANQTTTTGNFEVTTTTYKPPVPGYSQSANGLQVTWQPVQGTVRYDVWIDRVLLGGFSAVPQLVRQCSQGESFTLDSRFAEGATYNVWVRPILADDKLGVWSNATTFLVSSNPGLSVVVTAVSDVRQPRIEWTELPAAISYRVQIVDKTFPATPVVVVEKTGLTRLYFQAESLLAAGTYAVWVEATLPNSILASGWSSEFSIAASPTGALLSQTPQFTWQRVSGAATYELWVSKQDLSTTPLETAYYFPLVTGAANSYQHPTPLEAGSYVYWTRGKNAAGTAIGNWSAAIPFSIPDTLNITIAQQSQGPTVEWNSAQSGLVDIRIVRAEMPQLEVLREQFAVLPTVAVRNSYALRGGLAPGLYRIDVGPRSTQSAAPGWTSGPVFSFDGSTVNVLQAQGAAQSTSANLIGPFRGDFDGDGDQDVLNRNHTTGQVTVAINNSTAILASSTWNSNGTGGFTDFTSSGSSASVLVGDFNGDGRDDLVQPNMGAGTWSVMRSGTSGAFEKVVVPVTGLLNPDLPVFAWNAQTKVLSWKAITTPNSSASRSYELQIVLSGTATTYPSVVSTITKTANDNAVTDLTESLTALSSGEYTVFVRTSVSARVSQWSEGFGLSIVSGTPPAGTSAWQNSLVGDFNGDRRDDIAVFNVVRQQWMVSLSTGNTFEQSVWTTGVRLDGTYSRHTVIDVNGDGRKDIVAKNNLTSEWLASVSTGTSFLTQTWASPGFLQAANVGSAPFAADVDADGREDMVVWAGTDVRVAFSRQGSFQDASAGTTWSAVTGMPGNTVTADMNADGRADLIGFNGTGQSVVALSTATGFSSPAIWEVNSTTPWVIQLQNSGVTVADYGYRARSVQAAFDTVHNTIEFEAYRGLKKGADATLATKSGNAWDQANLLGKLISDGAFSKIEYVTGRMKLNESQVKDWLATSAIPAGYFEQAGLTPVTTGSTLIEFDHAWLRALMPTATGLGMVDLNPSLKAMLAADPVAAVSPFAAGDLNTYLNPVTNTFAGDFDAGGVTTGHHQATIPVQLQFQSGGGMVVTDSTAPAWPLVGGVADYKIQTSHGTPTNLVVGDKAVNGELSASITSLAVGQYGAQDFRVYARATEGYEVGIEWIQDNPSGAQIYERHGNTKYYLNAAYTVYPTDAPTVSLLPTDGYLPFHVKLIIDDSFLTVFIQWENGSTVSHKMVVNLTNAVTSSTVPGTTVPRPVSTLVSGRFGIQTAGNLHHYLDDIVFSGQDFSTANPLSWTIKNKLGSSDAAVRASVSGIGQTQVIQQSRLATIPVLLTQSSTPAAQWSTTPGRQRFCDSSGQSAAPCRRRGLREHRH